MLPLSCVIEIEPLSHLRATVREFLFAGNAGMKHITVSQVTPETIQTAFAVECQIGQNLLTERWGYENERDN